VLLVFEIAPHELIAVKPIKREYTERAEMGAQEELCGAYTCAHVEGVSPVSDPLAEP
jgi:hypothetical protein